MRYNNPIGSQKIDRMVHVAELGIHSQVLDVGCGTGELLMRCAEMFGVAGLGVDLDPAAIAEADRRAWKRVPGRLTFEVRDAWGQPWAEGSWDLGCCVGSVHAFLGGQDAFPAALLGLARAVRPGGYILVGDGYWRRAPPAGFLEFLGENTGFYRSHAENIAVGEASGLVPMFAVVANEDEWDVFEWTHRLRAERDAEARPMDPEARLRRDRSRAWRDAWLKWGRDTMGFGLYMFRRPLT